MCGFMKIHFCGFLPTTKPVIHFTSYPYRGIYLHIGFLSDSFIITTDATGGTVRTPSSGKLHTAVGRYCTIYSVARETLGRLKLYTTSQLVH